MSSSTTHPDRTVAFSKRNGMVAIVAGHGGSRLADQGWRTLGARTAHARRVVGLTPVAAMRSRIVSEMVVESGRDAGRSQARWPQEHTLPRAFGTEGDSLSVGPVGQLAARDALRKKGMTTIASAAYLPFRCVLGMRRARSCCLPRAHAQAHTRRTPWGTSPSWGLHRPEDPSCRTPGTWGHMQRIAMIARFSGGSPVKPSRDAGRSQARRAHSGARTPPASSCSMRPAR
jgi:hypothetical protein